MYAPDHPPTWEFPRLRGYLILGVRIIRILLFRVLVEGLLFSETQTLGSLHSKSGLLELRRGRNYDSGVFFGTVHSAYP